MTDLVIFAPLVAALGLMWHFQRSHSSDRKEWEAKNKELITKYERQQVFNTAVIRCILKLHQRHSLTGVAVGGLIAKRKRDYTAYADVEKVEKEEITKTLNELKIFHDDLEQVVSACRKLAMGSGDIDSLEMMRQIKKDMENEKGKEDIDACIVLLTDRLNDRIRTASYKPSFII